MEEAQRETDRSMCKADSETKAFRSEKKVLSKNVAKELDSRRTGSEPACPFHTSVPAGMWRGLWRDEAGEVGRAQ